MVQAIHQHPNKYTMRLFFVTIVFVVIKSTLPIMALKGFSLELIHRDSIHSPLCHRNLTKAKRIQQLVRYSNSRSWLYSLTDETHKMNMQTSVHLSRGMYLVKLHIGTPPTEVFLHLDTGSNLVWTQCEPCLRCFRQKKPKFEPKKSKTFKYITRSCSFSTRDDDELSEYEITYADYKYTRGAFAFDNFALESSSPSHREITSSLIFGCSTNSSQDMYPVFTGISGIMGMGPGEASFVRQLHNYAAGRFSYCLVRADTNAIGYVDFGKETPRSKDAQTIPLDGPNTEERETYLIDLQDISINGQRLNLPQSTFAVRPGGTGGSQFDTGSSFTILIRPAYEAVASALVSYFQRYKVIKVGSRNNLDLCFKRKSGFAAYPSMTFHFKNGATFNATGNRLFRSDQGTFCLLIKPGDFVTYIGTIMQENVRMAYDLNNLQITFFPEKCSP